MGCAEIQKLLSDYMNKELTPELQELTDRHLMNCIECRQMMAIWVEVAQQLSALREIPEFPNLRDITLSKIRQYEIERRGNADSSGETSNLIKGMNIGKRFFSQSRWRLATIGSTLVAIIVALTLTLLSSGGYDTVLAADIAQNSHEVQAALGGNNIQVLQIIEEKNIVVCSSGMQSPIVVMVDLKTKTVVAIADVDLPALTETEKKMAIDLAKSSLMISYSINENNLQNIEVYPVFIPGTVTTEIGEITLLPGPKMAIVKFDLEGDPSVVRAKVDLDAMMVMETQKEGMAGNVQSITSVAIPIGEVPAGSSDLSQSNMEKMKEEAKNRVIEMIKSDPIGKTLLGQGFSISMDDIWITFDDTHLESDTGDSMAVSTPASARVELKQGYFARMAFVDLFEKKVQWVPPPLELDTLSRESVLDILSASAKTNGLLERGAKTYVIGYRNIEYSLSEDGRLSGKSESSNFISVWLIIDDGLWMAEVDISSGKVTSVQEFPSELRLSSRDKEDVLNIIQSQPEVIELLAEGAKVIYFIGPTNQLDTDHRNGIAILYIEGTTYLWEAHVDIETREFMFLNRH